MYEKNHKIDFEWLDVDKNIANRKASHTIRIFGVKIFSTIENTTHVIDKKNTGVGFGTKK